MSAGNLGKLLIVEDDVPLTQYLRQLFEVYFDIRIAHDGEAGYKLAKVFQPDCVLSDIHMPGMSGIDMLQEIRKTPGLETIGVILLTVLDDRRDRIRGFDHLADLYFTKPFDPQELISATVGLVMMRQQMRRIFSGQPAEKDVTQKIPHNEIDDTFLHDVNHAVEGHISEFNIKIEDIAKAIGISVSELEHRIDQLEGIRARDYFLHVKLDHAKRLIDSGRVTSLDRLANQVGFINTSVFLQKFEDYFGFAPSIEPPA